MKPLFTILLALLLTLAGCGEKPETTTTPPMAGNLPSSQEPPPPESSSPSQPEQSAGISEENLQYQQQYLEPVRYSSFLWLDFGPGELDNLAGSPMIFAFEDLTGSEQMLAYWDTYQADLPREVVEDCLTAYFDVTPEQLRGQLLADRYSPSQQTYHYEGGRGGGPVEVEVTASRRTGDTLELDYNILTLSTDETSMVPTSAGTITIRVEGETGWKYISNRCRTP